jgi:hypothetical protein
MSEPRFGDRVRGIYAGETNPRREGFYVETVIRRGRLNPGKHYRITDGAGDFWETPAPSVQPVDNAAQPDEERVRRLFDPLEWVQGWDGEVVPDEKLLNIHALLETLHDPDEPITKDERATLKAIVEALRASHEVARLAGGKQQEYVNGLMTTDPIALALDKIPDVEMCKMNGWGDDPERVMSPEGIALDAKETRELVARVLARCLSDRGPAQ